MSWFAIEGCCDSHAIRECISCPDIIWGSLPCKKARNEERTSASGAAPPGRSSLAARMEKSSRPRVDVSRNERPTKGRGGA